MSDFMDNRPASEIYEEKYLQYLNDGKYNDARYWRRKMVLAKDQEDSVGYNKLPDADL